MKLRSSVFALVGLFACTASEDGSTSDTDGSTDQAQTDSEEGSTSASETSVTATSTTGASTNEGTTANPTVPPTDSATSGDTTDPAETSGSETTTSSSASETSDDSATSSSETGGDDGPAVQCTELEACCDEIGSDLYSGCITVVQMANPDLCDSILTTYHQEGYCTGETFCAELGDCCSELPPGPGWQDTCEYYADFGNQPQCAMLIGDYQLSDYCF